MSDWSDQELLASVKAYREMQCLERERKPYSRRKKYQELAALYGRSEKAFEYRMQNISALLDEAHEDWVPGLKPAGHVGSNVKKKILSMLIDSKPEDAILVSKGAEYKELLPSIRTWLVQVARDRNKVTYGEVMTIFGIGHRNLRRAMDYLGHQSENYNEPIITALIVSKIGMSCSSGFAKEFRIDDDQAEREKLYEYWGREENIQPYSLSERSDMPQQRLEVRAARFVSVEARPQQAAFRRAVFLACKGRCVVSGCDLVAALDAAHKHGRNWREGHNLGEDGFLLRKDLHSLYDAGLLSISESGLVEVGATAQQFYAAFHGTHISD